MTVDAENIGPIISHSVAPENTLNDRKKAHYQVPIRDLKFQRLELQSQMENATNPNCSQLLKIKKCLLNITFLSFLALHHIGSPFLKERFVMLVRSTLVFVYATFMASSVQASTVQAGASPAIEIVRSFSPGSAFIVDSYRSEDGHTYYEQQSSKLNDKPILFGAFSLGDDSGRPQANAHDQFGGSFSNTTKIGVGGGFNGGGFNGGGGIGGDGISSTGSIGGASTGFNGGKELFSFAGLPLNIESNALAITLARLDDDANRPGFEGGGYAGLAGAKENVSATPLPPTWTMMLTGLVGFGLFAYRRKSKSALTAA